MSTEPLSLETGLTLTPRIKLNLTIHRSDTSTKPLDEWQLKTSLIAFLKTTFNVTIPEEDLVVRKFKDIKKRKREDPVAKGCLFIRELGFLKKEKDGGEWRKMVVEKMDGIELSLAGVKFKLSVVGEKMDEFEEMRKEWEEGESLVDGGGDRGYSRGRKREPDTIVLRGVPSRWFAETRVSSKPSMFEDHSEFCKALKVLCGRSLQKQGSRLKADYKVTWDKDGIFRNARSQTDENYRSVPKVAAGNYRSEARYQSHFSDNSARSKRFKE
ncbi:hypothetical protein CTI12_AA408240 [Artemisia annua]|uniref:Uncharacterized protein n=1 Tax=Artemisia annua TaxID=35608 RepID=A0A2U1M169_ARTAN|nr:hypothetical protein CTI12_AA408240 [Artemisia annua]